MFNRFLYSLVIGALISSLALGAEVRKLGEYDLSWGPYGTTWTSPAGKSVRYLPRYFSTDAFTDNLTLYGKNVVGDNTGNLTGFDNVTVTGNVTGDNTGNISGFTIGGDNILSRPYVDVRDFAPAGTLVDGTVDWTTYIQAAIDNAIVSNIGGDVYIPPGTYKITTTLLIDSVRGLKITGLGYRSKLVWYGTDNTIPMITMRDCQECVIGDFYITVNTSLEKAFQLENGSGSAIAPSGNRLQNITVEGVASTKLRYGVYHAQGAGGDNNNDSTTIDHVTIRNYSAAAFYIGHAQSKGHVFRDSYGYGGTVGDYCVYMEHGSFSWYGGMCIGHDQYDFRIGSPDAQVTINGVLSEDSTGFILVDGVTSAPMPLSIIGCSWKSALAADNTFIQVKAPGPLTLIGNKFQSNHATNYPGILMNADDGAGFVSKGNAFIWTNKWVADYQIYNITSATTSEIQVDISGNVCTDNTAGAGGNRETFADNSATPTVGCGGTIWRTANTGATSITTLANAVYNVPYTIIFTDNNTTLVYNANTMRLAGAANFVATPNDTITLVKIKASNNPFIEISRSVN